MSNGSIKKTCDRLGVDMRPGLQSDLEGGAKLPCPSPGTQVPGCFVFYVEPNAPSDLQALSICCQALERVAFNDTERELVATWLNKKYGFKVEL